MDDSLTVAPQPARQDIDVLVSVRLTSEAASDRFLAQLRAEPAVVAAWWVAADVDAVLRLACRDLTVFEGVLSRLRLSGAVVGAVTYLLLRPIAVGPAVAGGSDGARSG
ncbi:Lrp/AsnC ligand binding domain-containing protein [Micromonospora sp. IBHARD004]|uniref:Lrp/AsnC ligand binding domain-containing protein n=1 Tax=Micromonospora sp. IBHARD004 TaxID=3457764 RepID=UPI004059E14A